MNLSLQAETALVYLVGCISILFRNIIVRRLFSLNQAKLWPLFWVDFLTLVPPMFVAQTFLTDHLMFIIAAQIALSTVIIFCPIGYHLIKVKSSLALRDSHTMFRALLLNTTALAILAVDFSLFPRRLAKTHYYGQSLMDTGTAAFVFINALADHSAESKGQKPGQRAVKATMQFSRIRIPTLAIIFLLGAGRSLFVNLSGYGQDVTEYGVHWNFFITLFFVRVFVILVPSYLIVFTGIIFGLIYQLCLTFLGVEEWIFDISPVRRGFIDQNREGIFSLFGYFFIYSISLLFARMSSHFLQKKKYLSLARIILIFGVSLIFFIAQKLLQDLMGLMASRRLANLPYCFSMLALFTATLTSFQFTQLLAPLSQANGGLVEAISRNALLHFMVANLLTGLVNMSMSFVKIHGNRPLETLALLIYLLTTSSLIYFVHLKRKS